MGMSSFVSRWVVMHRHSVTAADLDAHGMVRDDVLSRWIAEARDTYLERCAVFGELAARTGRVVRSDDRAIPSGADLGGSTSVAVSAGAMEVHPTSFTMAFRVRSYGSADDVVLNATSVISLVDPGTGKPCELGDAVRDELIALEHAARHTN